MYILIMAFTWMADFYEVEQPRSLYDCRTVTANITYELNLFRFLEHLLYISSVYTFLYLQTSQTSL